MDDASLGILEVELALNPGIDIARLDQDAACAAIALVCEVQRRLVLLLVRMQGVVFPTEMRADDSVAVLLLVGRALRLRQVCQLADRLDTVGRRGEEDPISCHSRRHPAVHLLQVVAVQTALVKLLAVAVRRGSSVLFRMISKRA